MLNCAECGGLVESHEAYLSHLNKYHKNVETYKCIACVRKYSSHNSLYKHIHNVHLTQTAHEISNEQLPNNTPLFLGSINSSSEYVDTFAQSSEPVLDGNYFLNKVNEECFADFTVKVNNIINLRDDDSQSFKSLNGFNTGKEFLEAIDHQAYTLFSKLHNYNEICYSRVQTISEDFSRFYKSEPFTLFGSQVLERLEQLGESREKLNEFKKMFAISQSPFQNYDSQYKRFNKFIEHGTFVKPETIKISARTDYKIASTRDDMVLDNDVSVTVTFVPLVEVYKKFVELPGVLDSVLEYMDQLRDSDIVQNYVQGDVWKKRSELHGDKPVLPKVVYFDEYG